MRVGVQESEQTHLEHGNYFADILQAGGAEPFWYYIIQRRDSNHITDL